VCVCGEQTRILIIIHFIDKVHNIDIRHPSFSVKYVRN